MILRGEVYDVDLGQPVGHEPAHRRPAVVVCSDIVSNSVGGLVAVVPVSSRSYGLRSHVELGSGESRLAHSSFAMRRAQRLDEPQRLEAAGDGVRVDQAHPGSLRALILRGPLLPQRAKGLDG